MCTFVCEYRCLGSFLTKIVGLDEMPFPLLLRNGGESDGVPSIVVTNVVSQIVFIHADGFGG